MAEKKVLTPSELGQVCMSFIKEIDSLATTLPFIMSIVKFSNDISEKEYNKFLEDKAIDLVTTENGRKYSVKIEDKAEHDKIQRKSEIYRKSNLIVPRSFFISLISQYDAFLGRLISIIFITKPELLNASDKQLTYQQLLDFGTIDNATDYLVEKEVETVLRKSHAKQFDWMEQTYAIPLRKGLDCWQTFIEATERRNLFVHNDGIVNNQYFKICKEHKVNIPEEIELNKKLHVSRSYFEKVHRCLLEIGVKLTHVLWRKLFEDRENADNNLINIIYDLIVNKNYHLAIELSNFATKDIKSYANDETRRYIILNKVISYKYGGKSEEAISILDKEDWSSCSDKYLLAVSVLKGDFTKSAQIMKRIGKDNESIDVLAYREWPLFKEFRKSTEFLEAYREVFEEEFVITEKAESEASAINSSAEDISTDGHQDGTEVRSETPPKRKRAPKCKLEVQPAAPAVSTDAPPLAP